MTTDTVPSEVHLPAREAEILACASKGLTDKQIAMELGISRDTVGTYWRRILLRYRASSRTEVVARASAKRLGSVQSEVNRLHEEIRERATAHNLLSTIQGALLVYVSGGQDSRQVFELLLKDLLALTQSEFGFIAEVKDAEFVQSLVMQGPWRTAEFSQLAQTAVAKRSPFFANDPIGSLGMESFLVIPLLFGEEVVGMVGIANRPGGYDAEWSSFLTPIAITCGTIIHSERLAEARRKAEEANTETVACLETLLNSLDSGVVFVDPSRKVRYVNSTFCRHFTPGFSPQEIIGMSTRTLLEEFKNELKEPDAFLEWIEKVVAEGATKRKETVHAADGRVFVCNFDAVRVGEKGIGHVWRYTQVLSPRSVAVEPKKRTGAVTQTRDQDSVTDWLIGG